MGPTGDAYRILQVHPTKRCNLRCLHCYSSSSPDEATALPFDLLQQLLTDASNMGYNVASFSGGEPLLYEHLQASLAHARRCGMITTVTSNGMLLDERRLNLLRGVVNLLAISLDGVPESHDRLRASPRAFRSMAARLEGVRRSGIAFGFIFTLTQYNLDELQWVAEFAMAQGAGLLQIHPLEGAGRALREMSGAQPDETESAFAYIEAARLQDAMGERLRIQLDLTDRTLLRAEPERGFVETQADAWMCSPAQSISPLVVEPDGTVVPVQYGFSRQYALGNLYQNGLRALAETWRREKEPAFRRLCREVFAEVVQPSELPFCNWYEILAQHAAAPASLDASVSWGLAAPRVPI